MVEGKDKPNQTNKTATAIPRRRRRRKWLKSLVANMAMRDLVSGAAACGDSSSSSSANPLASLANALIGSSSKTPVISFIHSSLISFIHSSVTNFILFGLKNYNRRGWRRFPHPLPLTLHPNFTPQLFPPISFPAPNSISLYWMQTLRFGLVRFGSDFCACVCFRVWVWLIVMLISEWMI